MSDKVAPELVEDIFNIPRNGKNIAEESDEDDLGLPGSTTNVSFDEKVQEVTADLTAKPVEKTVENTKESKVATANNDAETALRKTTPATGKSTSATVAEKKAQAATPSPKSTSSNLFDDDDAVQPVISPPKPKVVQPVAGPLKIDPPKVEQKPVTKEVVKVEAPLPDDPNEEELANDDTKSADTGPCEPWKAGESWLTVSPAPKYDRLYREKKIALTPGPNSILKGGQLDFDKLFDELSELNVDVTVKTYNPQDIHDKMQMVQQLRARLEHIRLQVSRQYHHWERYIELFHGVLCRTEYERGKQEGLNYDHLRDMEHYFCSLKSLYKASEGVMRTLDGAFECLSRQVTVVLPMKEIERYGSGNAPTPVTAAPKQSQPITSNPKPMTPSLRKFDALDDKTDTTEGDSVLPSSWKI